MNQVKTIGITQLNNGDFYQFNENIVAIVSNEPLAAGVIQPLAIKIPIMLNSYKKELLTTLTRVIKSAIVAAFAGRKRCKLSKSFVNVL